MNSSPAWDKNAILNFRELVKSPHAVYWVSFGKLRLLSSGGWRTAWLTLSDRFQIWTGLRELH